MDFFKIKNRKPTVKAETRSACRQEKTERNGVHVGLQSEKINCSGGWQVDDLQRHVNPEDLSVDSNKL